MPSELRGLTWNGIPIIRQEMNLGGPSNLNFLTPGPSYVPPPSPTYTYAPRPIPTPMRVSFIDNRQPLGPYGPIPMRPMGSGIGSSGYPADRVPIQPLPTPSAHIPWTTTGFRPRALGHRDRQVHP